MARRTEKSARPRARKPGPSKAIKTSKPAADHPGSALMGTVELADIRRLIALVRRTGIGELEVTSGDRSVRISAYGAAVAPPASAGVVVPGPGADSAPSPSPAKAAKPEAPSAPSTTVAITSPMVGTFYRAPAPDADPYAEVGDEVEVGQTVCIIEAMKLMNEIESEVQGRIVQVLVENAQPVEFGQTLFLVQPA
jgi:oxaloacetate decarboxylase (Na+ extruding) subunit alpha